MQLEDIDNLDFELRYKRKMTLKQLQALLPRRRAVSTISQYFTHRIKMPIDIYETLSKIANKNNCEAN